MHIMYSWLNILIYPTLPSACTRIAFQLSRIRQNTRHGPLNNQKKVNKKETTKFIKPQMLQILSVPTDSTCSSTFLPSFTQNLSICQAKWLPGSPCWRITSPCTTKKETVACCEENQWQSSEALNYFLQWNLDASKHQRRCPRVYDILHRTKPVPN